MDNKYEALAYLDEKQANQLKKFLLYSDLDDVNVEYNETSKVYEVQVLSKDYEIANNLYNAFMSEDEDNEDNEDNEGNEDNKDNKDNISQDNATVTVNLYENSEEKYKDNISSAITFFICGFAGLVVLVLNFLGIIKLVSKNSPTFIIINTVLGLLFVLFIGIGIWTLKYSKTIKKTAKDENDSIKKTIDWLEDNITIEDIEASYDNNIPEEMKYFSRVDFVKNAISNEFSKFDYSLIETIAERYVEDKF